MALMSKGLKAFVSHGFTIVCEVDGFLNKTLATRVFVEKCVTRFGLHNYEMYF